MKKHIRGKLSLFKISTQVQQMSPVITFYSSNGEQLEMALIISLAML